jgi:hypothetical protein
MLFVKIVNNEVIQVWDTQPPAGEAGWKSAVEVRPAITNRQQYTSHSFDLTKDPVEIVWGVRDVTVDERKVGLQEQAKFKFSQIVQAEIRKQTDQYPETQYDADVVDAARVVFETEMGAINSANTHDDLDALE